MSQTPSRVFCWQSESEGERGLANVRALSPIFQVSAHRLDKRFVIGKYFGTGTFECCGVILIGGLLKVAAIL